MNNVGTSKTMLCEVVVLLQTLLTVPVTTATAERTFLHYDIIKHFYDQV